MGGAAQLGHGSEMTTCNWVEGQSEAMALVQVRDGEALSHDRSNGVRRAFSKITQRQDHLDLMRGWI